MLGERGHEMHELELTWDRTMRMWWLLVWRMVVGGAILGLSREPSAL